MGTSVSGKVGNMVASDEGHLDASDGSNAGMDALHQCELIQNLIEISISSLKGLRTKCAASNDLTQQEIRTLEVMYLPMCILNIKLMPGCRLLNQLSIMTCDPILDGE